MYFVTSSFSRNTFCKYAQKIAMQNPFATSTSKIPRGSMTHSRESNEHLQSQIDRRTPLTYYDRVTDDTWLLFDFGSVLQPIGKLPVSRAVPVSLLFRLFPLSNLLDIWLWCRDCERNSCRNFSALVPINCVVNRATLLRSTGIIKKLYFTTL